MSTGRTKSFWATTEGGPLILIDRPRLHAWEGTGEPSGERIVEAQFRWSGHADAVATDYDRACDVVGALGVIPVGDGQGLVLSGDEPDPAAWLTLGTGRGVLVRPVYYPDGDSDENILRIAATAPEDVWAEEPYTLDLNGPVCVFDSAWRGREVTDGLVYSHLEIDLPPGEYAVETASYRPDDDVWLYLHRLSLKAAGGGHG